MPRTLGDVLHYFIPEAGPAEALARPAPARSPAPLLALDGGATPAPLPAAAPGTDAPPLPATSVIAIPLGPRDVVRAAFVWNLGVELTRLGASASILAPRGGEGAVLWPEEGPGPLGSELVLSPAESLGALGRSAQALLAARERDTPRPQSIVLAGIPPDWLDRPGDGIALVERALLFSSPDRRQLLETYAIAKRILALAPAATVGVTIHGVRSVGEAREAFHRLAGAAERHLLHNLASYGLVAGDLAVYRSILARRPVSLSQPQSAAARSLGAVARLLLADLAAPEIASAAHG